MWGTQETGKKVIGLLKATLKDGTTVNIAAISGLGISALTEIKVQGCSNDSFATVKKTLLADEMSVKWAPLTPHHDGYSRLLEGASDVIAVEDRAPFAFEYFARLTNKIDQMLSVEPQHTKAQLRQVLRQADLFRPDADVADFEVVVDWFYDLREDERWRRAWKAGEVEAVADRPTPLKAWFNDMEKVQQHLVAQEVGPEPELESDADVAALLVHYMKTITRVNGEGLPFHKSTLTALITTATTFIMLLDASTASEMCRSAIERSGGELSKILTKVTTRLAKLPSDQRPANAAALISGVLSGFREHINTHASGVNGTPMLSMMCTALGYVNDPRTNRLADMTAQCAEDNALAYLRTHLRSENQRATKLEWLSAKIRCNKADEKTEAFFFDLCPFCAVAFESRAQNINRNLYR